MVGQLVRIYRVRNDDTMVIAVSAEPRSYSPGVTQCLASDCLPVSVLDSDIDTANITAIRADCHAQALEPIT